MRLWLVAVILGLSANGAAHAEGATLGKCYSAITIARLHDNEWQETRFTPDECAAVAGDSIDKGMKMIDDGTKMMGDAAKDLD